MINLGCEWDQGKKIALTYLKQLQMPTIFVFARFWKFGMKRLHLQLLISKAHEIDDLFHEQSAPRIAWTNR